MNLMLCELSWQCVILTGWIVTMSAVVIVLVCYYLLKYYVQPKQKAKYEQEAKEKAFEREVSWKNLKELKASTDEGLKGQVKELETKVSELEGKLKAEEFCKELLEKKLKMYSDIFEQLKVEVKPKV